MLTTPSSLTSPGSTSSLLVYVAIAELAMVKVRRSAVEIGWASLIT